MCGISEIPEQGAKRTTKMQAAPRRRSRPEPRSRGIVGPPWVERERETEKEKESYISIILREGERVRARDMRERERHRERERDGDGRREGERGREENRGSVRAGERRGR